MTEPNFLIVGAMRSGTTSLFAYLSEHPNVFVPPDKELRFFDLNFDRGVSWYRRRFDGSANSHARGEASQTYMYDPIAVERMSSVVPGARLIAILRDPVERAYSHYWLNRARGREHLSFSEALAAEDSRLRGGNQLDRLLYSYADRGRYLVQLERLLIHYPRERILVLLFDDLLDRPRQTFHTVCTFLGIDERFRPAKLGERINAYQEFRSLRARRLALAMKTRGGRIGLVGSRAVGRLNRRTSPYPAMPASDRCALAVRFRPENTALSGWLGRGLQHWVGMTPGLARRDGP